MLTATRKPFRRQRAEAPTMAIGSLQRESVELPMGQVTYLRHGRGPPLLLVHGMPTSARLWEPLLGLLGQHYDCMVPDLLGLGRSVPKADADLGSPGQADMLAAFLDALGIEQCHAVFHDQGGSHGGQLLKRYGARIDAVVLTDIVCYDNWLVPMVALLNGLGPAIKPLAATRLLQNSMRFYPWTRLTTRRRLPAAIIEDWQYPLNQGGQMLDDWVRYATAQSPYWTQDAVPTLCAWDKPASVLWAAQDEFLPVSWAWQLARDIPTAADDPTLLPFAGHYWQMEVAESGAEAIHRFFSSVGSQ